MSILIYAMSYFVEQVMHFYIYLITVYLNRLYIL